MKIEHEDFVGIYRDVYPEGYCEHLISEFKRLEQSGAGSNRQQSENADRHKKDDYSIGIEIKNHNLIPFQNHDTCDLFFEGLQACYNDYTTKYSVLRETGSIRATTMKMQRTSPGGGYHIWHAEQGGGGRGNTSATRVLVYILYLNSLNSDAGGETELLYQRRRIAPEVNEMVITPASFTHSHRGNPVLADVNKYIVTGWFYYD